MGYYWATALKPGGRGGRPALSWASSNAVENRVCPGLPLVFQSLAYVRRGCQILAYGYAEAKNFGVTVCAGTHIFGRNPSYALCRHLNVL